MHYTSVSCEEARSIYGKSITIYEVFTYLRQEVKKPKHMFHLCEDDLYLLKASNGTGSCLLNKCETTVYKKVHIYKTLINSKGVYWLYIKTMYAPRRADSYCG